MQGPRYLDNPSSSSTMSKLAWIVVLAALTAAPAAAQQSTIPDLRGTWKGESESIILGTSNPHHAATPSAEPRLNSLALKALQSNRRRGGAAVGRFHARRQVDDGVR